MNQLPLLALVFIALFFWSILWTSLLPKLKIGTLKSPPSPLGLPFLGHLHLMMRGQPHHVLMDLSRRYGPIFSLRFGSVPVVVASSPKSAKEFLKTHDLTCASRPPLTAARLLAYNAADIVFAPYGNRLRQLRRLASELFTVKRLETFQQQRMEEIQLILQSISNSMGSKVNLSKKLKQLTFNMTTQMLISKRYFGDNVEDIKEAEEFIHVFNKYSEICGSFSVGEYLPYLRWLDVDGTEAKFKEVAAAIDSFLEKIIYNRVNKMQQKVGPMDFLDILLQLRDDGEQIMQGNTIKALMMNMIASGTDSTSITVEWALAELIKQPSLLSKVQEEIAEVVGTNQLVEEHHISQMPFLQAIIKETFRLHPSGPLMLPHYAMENCKVMGYDIAVGTMIIVNVYAIQRDPSVWKDASNFNPERFLESQIDFRGHNFELIPFGSGRRMCLAISLGLIMVQLAVANLLHAFDMEVPQSELVDTVTEKYRVGLPPAKNLELLCHPRLPINLYKKVPS